MPRNKKEDTTGENIAEVNEAALSEQNSAGAVSDPVNDTVEQNVSAVEYTEPKVESSEIPAENNGEAGKSENTEEPSLISSVFEAVTSAVGSVAGAVVDGGTDLINSVSGNSGSESSTDNNDRENSSLKVNKISNRAEKIGTVQSDKMTKTVTVRVDRVVKHPMYRKYVKRRKQFMAHDELGAKAGDRVRIVETRPLSARKRWRVVEIIQKAER